MRFDFLEVIFLKFNRLFFERLSFYWKIKELVLSPTHFQMNFLSNNEPVIFTQKIERHCKRKNNELQEKNWLKFISFSIIGVNVAMK